jgi:hypothetical protein
MSALVRLFFSIALFRKGPQDVPYSPFLLVSLFILTFSIELLTHLIPSIKEQAIEFPILLRYLLIKHAVTITVIYLIFKLHGHVRRFTQSLTTMFGVDVLMSAIFLPINFLLVFAAINESAGFVILGSLLYMFLLGWNLFIYMHIFRHALSVSPLYGGMLSLALFALGITLVDLLIPGGSS